MNREILPSVCLGILLLAPTAVLCSESDAAPQASAPDAPAAQEPIPAAVEPQETVAGPGVEEVTNCIKSNVPKQSSVQLVEFTSYDRIGGERVSRAKIYAKKLEADSTRRVLMRFTKPLEIRGSAFLAIEQDAGSPDMFLYTPEMRKVKRVTGQSGGGALFGTDFSYEDFARWQGLLAGQTARRVPPANSPPFTLAQRPPAELLCLYCWRC